MHKKEKMVKKCIDRKVLGSKIDLVCENMRFHK